MKLKKERNSSFELLRLILMMMIVAHHCIVHGLALSGIGGWTLTKLPLAVQPEDMQLFMSVDAFFICAVDVFVLLSGYFSIRLSWNKVLHLLFQMLFYSAVSAVAWYFLVDHNLSTLVKGFMFLSNSAYWFLIDYLILMAFAPMINNFYRDYSKRETGLFTLVLLFVSCYLGFKYGHVANKDGYTVFQFIMMYSLGRYIRQNNVRLAWRKSLPLYIGCSLLIGFAMYYLYLHKSGETAWKVTYYNDPLVILSAISLFFVFQSLDFRSKWVNKCSASALAIYLFHCSFVIKHFLYPPVRQVYLSNNNVQFGGVKCY
jgi:surface polysaccharide O-acyltransferase-like enzyme